jgi:tetratricopeptide (TPR) repeat protein
VLSQHAVRNAFLCVVPVAFMLRRARDGMASARAPVLAACTGASLLLVAFDDHVLSGYGGLSEARAMLSEDLAPATFPSELATFMREAKIEGGIFNDARWGGYLIWQLWPQNHVFVDSRQDLSPEMWPLFLAAQSAGTRPPAMEQAFRRWGIGLAAFRGPTFPAVRAPESWQLLYKAGDQELYQRRMAPNAATNIARARDYLTARARDPNVALEQLAIEVGSARFLAAPYQRFRAQKADALLHSTAADEAAEGLRLKASLWFEAGLYPAALGTLEALLRVQPDNVKALYQAALAALALGEDARAHALLRRLAAQRAQLSAQQMNRLHAIDPTDFF